ncbi:MAG: NERD domain-containing protein [Oscillospiraceae bacterium]|jgi:ssDNA-binding Zn-finger/Zn-ribbon topoisomerase 1|nr:NERD domain-containing protein [Oscillospiraceae bacterium]
MGEILKALSIIYKYKTSEYAKSTKNGILKVYNDRGGLGEYFTYEYLKEIIGYKKFLFNVYIPKEDGSTTEIDLIMLHPSGIYVIESKNYSGWIFGHENQRIWTQCLSNKQKNKFYNPIMQNKGHTKYLSEYLSGFNGLPFRSIIVFSEHCELKSVTLTTAKHRVVKRSDLLNCMSSFINTISERIVTVQEIDDIYKVLLPLTTTSKKQKQMHVKNIKGKIRTVPKVRPLAVQAEEDEKLEEAQEIIEVKPVDTPAEASQQPASAPALCPKCGAAMVRRRTVKGKGTGREFWGCTNFPTCRSIINIEQASKAKKLKVVKATPKAKPIAAKAEKVELTPPAQTPVLCPKCGAAMIRRRTVKGKYKGKEFWGCPNFPKCRSIVNI